MVKSTTVETENDDHGEKDIPTENSTPTHETATTIPSAVEAITSTKRSTAIVPPLPPIQFPPLPAHLTAGSSSASSTSTSGSSTSITSSHRRALSSVSLLSSASTSHSPSASSAGSNPNNVTTISSLTSKLNELQLAFSSLIDPSFHRFISLLTLHSPILSSSSSLLSYATSVEMKLSILQADHDRINSIVAQLIELNSMLPLLSQNELNEDFLVSFQTKLVTDSDTFLKLEAMFNSFHAQLEKFLTLYWTSIDIINKRFVQMEAKLMQLEKLYQ
jgi:hypothetical protein